MGFAPIPLFLSHGMPLFFFLLVNVMECHFACGIENNCCSIVSALEQCLTGSVLNDCVCDLVT